MSQKIRVTLISDLAALEDPDTKVEADGTVRFGFAGDEYEIDMTAEEQAAFEEKFSPYLAAARKLPNRRKKRGQKAAAAAPQETMNTEEIRAWAREAGHDVKDRGRVPSDLVAKYKAATGK